MIETWGLAISIEVMDAMLKAANVSIVHHEKVDIALISIIIEGDLNSVQLAINKGKELAERAGALIAITIIPNPDYTIKHMVEKKKKLSITELLIKEW